MKNSVVIDRLPHSCGTMKGLVVYADEEGKVDGFCWSCNKYVENPYGEPKVAKDVEVKHKTQEDIDAEIAEIAGYKCVDVPARKLREANLVKFGVKIGLSERDGKTPNELYFPYRRKGKVVGYKVKTIGVVPSRVWSVGDCKDVDMFGWEEALTSTSPTLIITEGEADAVAVDRIFELHGKNEYHPAIVSLPHGAAQAGKAVLKHLDAIKRRFKNVVLAFDMDEAGEVGVKSVQLLLPDAKRAHLPSKDANACILEGKAKAAYKALLWDAQKARTGKLVMAASVHEAAKVPPTYGELTWPFPYLNKKLRGIRYGETIYVGAGVKCGKSELLNELVAHFIQSHGIKVMVAKPEEDNRKTYKLVAGKIAGKRFHDPDVEFDEEAFDRAGEVIDDKLAMVDIYQNLDWGTLRDTILEAHGWGAKAIFIDPITVVTNGVDAASANTLLQDMAQNLAAMAKDLNIVIFIFCHLKAHDGNISKEQRLKKYKEGEFWDLGNCPHEMGGTIFSTQFAGSRAMMRSANLMLGLEANKDEDLDENIRNTRRLRILEDREFGETGSVQIFWNKTSTRFLEA